MFSRNIKIVLFLLMFAVATEVYSVGPDEQEGQNQRFIVQLKEDTDKEKILREGIDGREVRIISEFDSIHTIVVEFTDGLEVDADLEDENVETIIKDRVIQWINPTEKDDLEVDAPEAGKMTVHPGIQRIRANTFGDSTNVKVDATVAIIDSGIDANHKSLNVVKQLNFIPEETSEDLDGHGTHVAGTVAAKIGEKGFFGVAPGANLIALKVINQDGRGSLSGMIQAIDWVTQHADEVDVVNMSLGGPRGPHPFDLMHEAIKKSVAKGVVYVVAAGNDTQNIYYGPNMSMNSVPASYPEVMTVSAMVASDGVAGGHGPLTNAGKDDTRASFSNYFHYTRVLPYNPVRARGGLIDVAAPGVDIYSTAPGNEFQVMSGTSMASPHVAGAVARYIAKNRRTLFPNGKKDAQTVYQIRQTFIDQAEPWESWAVSPPFGPKRYLEGLVQIVE